MAIQNAWLGAVRICCIAFVCLLIVSAGHVSAQGQDKEDGEQSQAQPPSPVVIATSRSGEVVPQNRLIGTVYYPEISEVAAEVSGRVDSIKFREGDRLQAGDMLVTLSKDIASKELEAAVANYQEVLSELENARLELERYQKLIKQGSIAQSEFDDTQFQVQSLERKARSLESRAELWRIRLSKAGVPAPYDGVVLEKHVGRGEWVQAGTPIATMARDDYLEVVVDIPSDLVEYATPGREVKVLVSGQELTGEILSLIPRGDLATRTFPLKIRIDNSTGLAQGMDAVAWVPAGNPTDAVLVPRDAVILQRGEQMMWIVKDGAAAPVPVEVDAYVGLDVAVRGPGVKPGMEVVVKGNERLRPGQPVAPQPLAGNGTKEDAS